MKRTNTQPTGGSLLTAFVLLLATANSLAQQVLKHGDDHPNVTLHTNAGLGMCDFDLAPELTQSEWRRATREVGSALYLEPLAGAKPLGKCNWTLQLENNSFHVDQESGAWNNTFHHPDSTHYLTDESGRLSVPGLRFRMGLSERFDVGIYYTSAKPFGANYGFIGFDARYAVMIPTEKGWAANVRTSYVRDAAIRDFNIHTTAVEVVGSKQLLRWFYPYAGIAGTWSYAREVTNDVDLSNEHVLGMRALAGVQFRWKWIDFAYEFQLGDGMTQRSLKVGVAF